MPRNSQTSYVPSRHWLAAWAVMAIGSLWLSAGSCNLGDGRGGEQTKVQNEKCKKQSHSERSEESRASRPFASLRVTKSGRARYRRSARGDAIARGEGNGSLPDRVSRRASLLDRTRPGRGQPGSVPQNEEAKVVAQKGTQ